MRNSGKPEKLMREAELDFKIGNLNKCVSASYFTVRKMLEHLAVRMKMMIPRRDDKLANILKHIGYGDEAKLVLRLYELRKKADYDDKEITEDEAEEALKIAENLTKLIKSLQSGTD